MREIAVAGARTTRSFEVKVGGSRIEADIGSETQEIDTNREISELGRCPRRGWSPGTKEFAWLRIAGQNRQHDAIAARRPFASWCKSASRIHN